MVVVGCRQAPASQGCRSSPSFHWQLVCPCPREGKMFFRLLVCFTVLLNVVTMYCHQVTRCTVSTNSQAEVATRIICLSAWHGDWIIRFSCLLSRNSVLCAILGKGLLCELLALGVSRRPSIKWLHGTEVKSLLTYQQARSLDVGKI